MKRHRWVTLYDRIKDIQYPVGVELGVHRAEMSENLLKLHPGLTLTMIDAWSRDTYEGVDPSAASEESRKIYQDKCEENFNFTRERVEQFNGRIYIIREKSLNAVKLFPDRSLDFVFIDAAHDYASVKKDISAWIKKIKVGGIICGHDYDLFPGVTKAVDELLWGVEFDEDYTWFTEVN